MQQHTKQRKDILITYHQTCDTKPAKALALEHNTSLPQKKYSLMVLSI